MSRTAFVAPAPAGALDGARAAPTAWPRYDDEEIEAAARVLRSGKVNYWTGEEGRLFEEEFARAVGAAHGVACANGTVALELALEGLGIGEGDEVIVTPRSFVASASAIAMAGARPIFADVDPVSQNITPSSVAPLIGPRAKAILCVHFAGWPCDMKGLRALIGDRPIALIEDCAQAHGARYGGRSVGALGDVAAWSFCQDKIMSTGGEGGMVTTNDPALHERIWSLKDHGKSYDAVFRRPHPPGFRWLVEDFGSNGRMTEVQAAIGRIQLRRLEATQAARAREARALEALLAPWTGAGGPLRLALPEAGADLRLAHYRLHGFVRPERLPEGFGRDDAIAALTAQGLPCMAGSCSEIYRERAFAKHGLAPASRLPVAKALGETSIAFFTHPGAQRPERLDDPFRGA